MSGGSPDVVVIGGGLIGGSIAWRLAQGGARVALLDARRSAGPASWAAAGMLSPLGQFADHAGFNRLALRSRALYPGFVAELEQRQSEPIEFGAPGKIEVAFTPSELQRLRATLGTRAQWLAPAAARGTEPELGAAAVGAALLEHDALVDNRQLHAAVTRAAIASGVHWRDAAATGIEVGGRRLTGVRLDSGKVVAAHFVVIAAGAWSGQLAGVPRPLPVFPVKGQMLALRVMRPLRFMLESAEVYLIPRSGNRVLVGATLEQVGFAAGTEPDALGRLRAAAERIVPALQNATVIDGWFGFRPCTPDQLPILGPDPDVKGLVYASGHYRNGILLAPVTAEVISKWIGDGLPAAEFGDFGVERFK